MAQISRFKKQDKPFLGFGVSTNGFGVRDVETHFGETRLGIVHMLFTPIWNTSYLPPLAYIVPAPTLTQNRNAANAWA